MAFQSSTNSVILIRRRTSVIIIEYFPLVSDRYNPVTCIPVCLRPVLKRSKTNIELHVVKRVKLLSHACYKHNRLWYFRSSFSFLCLFDLFRRLTIIRYVAHSFWSTFKRVFKSTHFDENAQRISVDGRPKRIEMYATFSNENSLVLTCWRVDVS